MLNTEMMRLLEMITLFIRNDHTAGKVQYIGHVLHREPRAGPIPGLSFMTFWYKAEDL